MAKRARLMTASCCREALPLLILQLLVCMAIMPGSSCASATQSIQQTHQRQVETVDGKKNLDLSTRRQFESRWRRRESEQRRKFVSKHAKAKSDSSSPASNVAESGSTNSHFRSRRETFNVFDPLEEGEWCDRAASTGVNDTAGSYGIMFDVLTKEDASDVEIKTLSFYTDVDFDVEYEVFTKAGTYEGFEMSVLSDWKRVASGTTQGRGIGRMTPIDEEDFTPVTIPAGGSRQAFYVTLTTIDIRYSEPDEDDAEDSDEEHIVSNRDIEVTAGIGVLTYPVDGYFSQRRHFLGAIFYQVRGAPADGRSCDDDTDVPTPSPSAQHSGFDLSSSQKAESDSELHGLPDSSVDPRVGVHSLMPTPTPGVPRILESTTVVTLKGIPPRQMNDQEVHTFEDVLKTFLLDKMKSLLIAVDEVTVSRQELGKFRKLRSEETDETPLDRDDAVDGIQRRRHLEDEYIEDIESELDDNFMDVIAIVTGEHTPPPFIEEFDNLVSDAVNGDPVRLSDDFRQRERENGGNFFQEATTVGARPEEKPTGAPTPDWNDFSKRNQRKEEKPPPSRGPDLQTLFIISVLILIAIVAVAVAIALYKRGLKEATNEQGLMRASVRQLEVEDYDDDEDDRSADDETTKRKAAQRQMNKSGSYIKKTAKNQRRNEPPSYRSYPQKPYADDFLDTSGRSAATANTNASNSVRDDFHYHQYASYAAGA